MSDDIGRILGAWDYEPGELRVRTIDGEKGDGQKGERKIQIRIDLGIMQLTWSGRPDGTRPHDRESLLDHYERARAQWEGEENEEAFTLSHQDCWALGQEAMQYYWRRISFFELKEYERAEEDAVHNLGILDLCESYAEHDEDRSISDQYRVFVTAHRIQARALRLLEQEDHEEALNVIRGGIAEVEQIIEGQGELEYMEESPELKFLNQWEKEVEESRPLSPHEKLNVDLRTAVEQEKFELAASLRDEIRKMEE